MLLCKLIDETTLYYFFSTTAQVMAAVTALLAIFNQYKLSELKDLLVGDGVAVYTRIDNIRRSSFSVDAVIQNLNPLMIERLSDAIARKDLYSIGKFLEYLSDFDIKKTGQDRIKNPKSYDALRYRFTQAIKDRNKLNNYAKSTLIFSLFSITISIISIPYTKYLINNCMLMIIDLSAIALLSFSSLVIIGFDIFFSLKPKIYDFEKQGWK